MLTLAATIPLLASNPTALAQPLTPEAEKQNLKSVPMITDQTVDPGLYAFMLGYVTLANIARNSEEGKKIDARTSLGLRLHFLSRSMFAFEIGLSAGKIVHGDGTVYKGTYQRFLFGGAYVLNRAINKFFPLPKENILAVRFGIGFEDYFFDETQLQILAERGNNLIIDERLVGIVSGGFSWTRTLYRIFFVNAEMDLTWRVGKGVDAAFSVGIVLDTNFGASQAR